MLHTMTGITEVNPACASLPVSRLPIFWIFHSRRSIRLWPEEKACPSLWTTMTSWRMIDSFWDLPRALQKRDKVPDIDLNSLVNTKQSYVDNEETTLSGKTMFTVQEPSQPSHTQIAFGFVKGYERRSSSSTGLQKLTVSKGLTGWFVNWSAPGRHYRYPRRYRRSGDQMSIHIWLITDISAKGWPTSFSTPLMRMFWSWIY